MKHYKKNYLTKQQIMPSAECCKQNHMNTRLFDLSFYSTVDFFIHLHRYVSENFHFKRKIQRFVAQGRSKIISLQDFPCLHCWYSCLFIACVLVFLPLSFSLSPFIFFLCLSTYSMSYTWIYSFLQNLRLFFQKAVGHASSRQKKRGLQHWVWVSHFTLAYTEGRTYVRTIGRTEVTP